MIDILRGLSQIVEEEGVENDDNDELGQGIEVCHLSCNVCEWSYRLKGMRGHT